MTKDFSFGRVDNITEIHLTDKIQSITLAKSKTGWIADGQYKVKEQLPELFLNVINTVKVKAPASKKIRDQLRDQLVNSKHIDIFKGHHKVCSYYILFDSAYTEGTFLMKKWAKLPLEVEITGLQIPVANLYHCELAYWKARFVFPLSAENIEWISLENKAQPSASFKIERVKGAGISLTTKDSEVSKEKIDLIAANDYFASLAKVQYLKEVEASDSVDLYQSKMMEAEYIIRVKTTNQDPIELKFHPYYSKGSNGMKKNADLFIGTSSISSVPFIGKYFDFDPIIRSFSYFLNKQ
jgi:hypothetical protein